MGNHYLCQGEMLVTYSKCSLGLLRVLPQIAAGLILGGTKRRIPQIQPESLKKSSAA